MSMRAPSPCEAVAEPLLQAEPGRRGSAPTGVASRTPQNEEPISELGPLVEALKELRRIDKHRFRVIEMSLFHGLSLSQMAARLGVPDQDIERDWNLARTFLFLRTHKLG